MTNETSLTRESLLEEMLTIVTSGRNPLYQDIIRDEFINLLNIYEKSKRDSNLDITPTTSDRSPIGAHGSTDICTPDGEGN